MLTVTSSPLELRGIANKVSAKTEKVYYILNCECDDGDPVSFYCPDASVLPPGLRKGTMVTLTFDVSFYKGNERLTVSAVEVAG